MSELSFNVFNGITPRKVLQSAEPRKSRGTNEKDIENLQRRGRFYTNPDLMARFWPSVDSAVSMDSLVRNMGGKRNALNTLKALSPSKGNAPQTGRVIMFKRTERRAGPVELGRAA